MDRWEHLHDLNKVITTLGSALLALSVGFAKDFTIESAWGPWLLSGVYLLLGVSVFLSVLAMCFANPVFNNRQSKFRTVAISTTNASFIAFGLAMLLITTIGIAHACARVIEVNA